MHKLSYDSYLSVLPVHVAVYNNNHLRSLNHIKVSSSHRQNSAAAKQNINALCKFPGKFTNNPATVAKDAGRLLQSITALVLWTKRDVLFFPIHLSTRLLTKGPGVYIVGS